MFLCKIMLSYRKWYLKTKLSYWKLIILLPKIFYQKKCLMCKNDHIIIWSQELFLTIFMICGFKNWHILSLLRSKNVANQWCSWFWSNKKKSKQVLSHFHNFFCEKHPTYSWYMSAKAVREGFNKNKTLFLWNFP